MKISKMKLAAACLAAISVAGGAAHAATPEEQQLVNLAQRHAQAQNAFDQAALRAATAENYVEISPRGEVDSREKMLSFYAPEKKTPAPQLQFDEADVRIWGDTAVILARLTYTVDQNGTPRSFALRGGYVARQIDHQWLLVSAQYTGIPPVKK